MALQGSIGALAAPPASPFPAGSSGHDISWPQCGAAYPTDGAFGVVGVTNGRAWSTNPCYASAVAPNTTSEYQWAAGYPTAPQLYMNTANPAPTSRYYWPKSGASDPALCVNAASTTDPGCAYDYGFHTAANALATAQAAGSAATGYWWLDVETGNTWNGNGTSNAADLQGSIDYLMQQGVPGVGVYSTGLQWTRITGGYSASNAAQYQASWTPDFPTGWTSYGIDSSPAWVAGASSASTAPGYCGSSFLGTTTWMVQYIANNFDVDYACGTVATAGDYSITLPASVSASTGASVSVPVTLTSTGGWTGTVALSVKAPARVSATLSSSSVALDPNGTATTTLTLHSNNGGSYTVTVTAAPLTGSSTTTSHSASTSFTVGGAHRATF